MRSLTSASLDRRMTGSDAVSGDSSQFAQEFHAVAVGQEHVEHDETDGFCAQRLARFGDGGAAERCGSPAAAKRVGEIHADRQAVVDDEHRMASCDALPLGAGERRQCGADLAERQDARRGTDLSAASRGMP